MTRRLLAIGFRNLLGAKRRNLLAGGSLALGTACMVLASGLTDGITRQLSDNLVAIQTGHLQIVVRPHDFESQDHPFDAYGQERLPGAAALAERIEEEARDAGVVRAVPYLFVRGSAIAGSRSTNAWIVGIEPAREVASGETIVALMEEINRREGTTFIFSTHDPRIMARAHRVLRLADGRVEA